MIHRSIALVLALALAGTIDTVEAGLHLRDVNSSTEPQEPVADKKFEMTDARGVKCTAGTKDHKEGFGRQCEGGMKKTVDLKMDADDLADDLASEIGRMLADMMPQQQGLRPDDDAMAELGSRDGNDGLEDFEKTIEFGGFAKLFWGCNVTFGMKDGEMSKKVACGGKSFEGMGEKFAQIVEYEY